MSKMTRGNFLWDMFCDISLCNTVQKSHYPPGNHHASHLKNVIFPGHNQLLTTGTDDPSL